MIINLAAAARVVPLAALMLGACVSQGHTNSKRNSFNRLAQSRRRSRPNSRGCHRKDV